MDTELPKLPDFDNNIYGKTNHVITNIDGTLLNYVFKHPNQDKLIDQYNQLFSPEQSMTTQMIHSTSNNKYVKSASTTQEQQKMDQQQIYDCLFPKINSSSIQRHGIPLQPSLSSIKNSSSTWLQSAQTCLHVMLLYFVTLCVLVVPWCILLCIKIIKQIQHMINRGMMLMVCLIIPQRYWELTYQFLACLQLHWILFSSISYYFVSITLLHYIIYPWLNWQSWWLSYFIHPNHPWLPHTLLPKMASLLVGVTYFICLYIHIVKSVWTMYSNYCVKISPWHLNMCQKQSHSPLEQPQLQDDQLQIQDDQLQIQDEQVQVQDEQTRLQDEQPPPQDDQSKQSKQQSSSHTSIKKNFFQISSDTSIFYHAVISKIISSDANLIHKLNKKFDNTIRAQCMLIDLRATFEMSHIITCAKQRQQKLTHEHLHQDEMNVHSKIDVKEIECMTSLDTSSDVSSPSKHVKDDHDQNSGDLHDRCTDFPPATLRSRTIASSSSTLSPSTTIIPLETIEKSHTSTTTGHSNVTLPDLRDNIIIELKQSTSIAWPYRIIIFILQQVFYSFDLLLILLKSVAKILPEKQANCIYFLLENLSQSIFCFTTISAMVQIYIDMFVSIDKISWFLDKRIDFTHVSSIWLLPSFYMIHLVKSIIIRSSCARINMVQVWAFTWIYHLYCALSDCWLDYQMTTKPPFSSSNLILLPYHKMTSMIRMTWLDQLLIP